MVALDRLHVEEDLNVYRHWHVHSEKFAGGDALATLLLTGWLMRDAVFVDTYWLSGSRTVHVYQFELMRDDESVSMPVIANPYVERLIALHQVNVVPIERPALLAATEREHEQVPVAVPARQRYVRT
jgi:hypothetical protein